MRLASLCTGIGGIDLALERAGAETVFQCEQDAECLRVLGHHWPRVERTENVNEKRTERAVRRLRPDIIAFGSPCQDLSVAGKRSGLAGQRSGIFFRCMELAYSCAAPWVLFENVPGLFSSNGGEDLASVLEAFTGIRFEVPAEGWRSHGAAIGPLYCCAWAVLDAQWFGVPQRRRRVFVIGCLGNRASPLQILSLIESGQWDSPKGREAKPGTSPGVAPGARRAGGDRGGERLITATMSGNGDAHGGFRLGDGLAVAETLQAHHGRNSPDDSLIAFEQNRRNEVRDLHNLATAVKAKPGMKNQCYIVNAAKSCAKQSHARQTDVARCLDSTGGFASSQGGTVIAHTLRSEGADAGEDGTGRGVPLVYDVRDNKQGNVAHTIQAGGHGACPNTVPLLFQPRCASNGRGMPGEVAPALTSAEGGSHADTRPHLIGAGGIRRLTPTECLRLQGLPDDWLDLDLPLSDSAKYRMIGNSVTVPVLLWIGHRIMAAQQR